MASSTQNVTATTSLQLAGGIALGAILIAGEVGQAEVVADAQSVELIGAEVQRSAALVAAEIGQAQEVALASGVAAGEDVLGTVMVAAEMAGQPGRTGPKGDRGETGVAGPVGGVGPAGDVGPAGPAGPRGEKGDKGDAGPIGPVGPQGERGEQGVIGPQGVPGVAGPAGPAGVAGANGVDGLPGADGATGPMGPIGPAGVPGVPGVPGAQGPKGDKGDKGDPGETGGIGPAGPKGADADTQEAARIAADAVLATEFHFGDQQASLADVAEMALTPTMNFVGVFVIPPEQVDLGLLWRKNAVYKNAASGIAYVLTDTPLRWVEFIVDGAGGGTGGGSGSGYTMVVQSTLGTVYKPGDESQTMLVARLFLNGEEATEATPATWFSWRRVSSHPALPPNDDASWNAAYSAGYRQVMVPLAYRASYFCDIVIR